MRKIRVDLYVPDNYELGDGGKESQIFDVSDEEYEALSSIDRKSIDCHIIEEAVNEGTSPLLSLHTRLSEAVYSMVKHYIVHNMYNELESDSLADSFQNDLNNGVFPQEVLMKFRNCILENESIPLCSHQSGNFSDNGVTDGLIDISEYYDLLQKDYRDWVYQHKDPDFIAHRTGLCLDECKDMYTVEYTLYLDIE